MKQKVTIGELARAGLRLFKERGFENVSVMDICDEVGITKPTFYRFVPSKEALVLYFYSDADDDLAQRMATLELEGRYVDAVWEGLVCVIRRSKELGRDLYSRYLSYCLRIRTYPNQMAMNAQEMIVDAIRMAQEAGQVENMSDPAELFTALVTCCMGSGCSWTFTTAPLDPLALFDKYFKVILRVKKSEEVAQ